MGRKKLLDDVKKREVCALVTAGMTLAKVAEYVGCDRRTIHAERQADDGFDTRIRRARMARDLNPREAMRRFAATHWRAAAWMLEREERQQAARNPQRYEGQFTPSDFDALAEEVKALAEQILSDPFAMTHPTVNRRIEILFKAAKEKTMPVRQRMIRGRASGDRFPSGNLSSLGFAPKSNNGPVNAEKNGVSPPAE